MSNEFFVHIILYLEQQKSHLWPASCQFTGLTKNSHELPVLILSQKAKELIKLENEI